MYHRFEENKYPSTNIRINDFFEHIKIIKEEKIKFIRAEELETSLKEYKNQRKVLLTIDDAFLSFYENAWPFLKKEKIPFILFVSTREVGKSNYMTWKQIQEISKEEYVHIANHSHSHEYLINKKDEEIIQDIKKSILIFEKNLNTKTDFFSYPFGEYSLAFKKIIKDFGFKFAFGQHSGVIDETKDYLELPRFPINEKYGEIKRFKSLIRTLPFKYKSISPEEKYIYESSNPPRVIIDFYENVHNINCYSNENNKWRKSNINFLNNNKIEIKLDGKFTTERGRINCSLREKNGLWRWLGMQFVLAEN
ncbi:MAG: polysaccharide deacetylase family protein [Pelagibacteraceae bacterium]